MDKYVAIIKDKNSNLLDALIYYMDQEKINYVIMEKDDEVDSNITHIISIGNFKMNKVYRNSNIPMILISNKKIIMDNLENQVKNYMITTLVDDDKSYTSVQKEYLFKKGIYSIFLQKIGELLENTYHYNGMIYDLTEIKSTPSRWIFNFDSISETYYWLLKKNRSMKDDFIRKAINFCSDKVYDDSIREINYLTEKILDIKNKRRSIDLFIGTKEELKVLKNNYFFKALLKNCSSTYSIYLIDKKELAKKNPSMMEEVLDGICIYDDCIYRDTYSDELSLGYVDCNQETIDLYHRYFDELMNQYGYQISSESDMNEFLK